MQRTMAGQLRVCIFSISIAFMTASTGQTHRGYPTPPAPAVREDAPVRQVNHATRLDTIAMEREAKELAVLASSIPGDVELMKKGLLPSDAFDRLKRIEKLSKQLRAQLRP